MARQQGDLARAATLFITAEAWREARECYAQAGQRRQAAELSERLGDWAHAARTWEALNDPDRAAAAYLEAKEWRQAAQIYERTGALPQAAACREKTGDWTSAALLYERADRLDDAVRCHRQAGNWRRVGELEQQQGHFPAAARALIQAAQSLAARSPAARSPAARSPQQEDELADLWSAAEDCCVKTGDEAEATQCRIQAARLRHQPYIEMEIVPPQQMVIGRYELLRFTLHNVGGGVAHKITVHHIPSDFVGELKKTLILDDLKPGHVLRQDFAIQPQVSGPVPLGIDVDYTDDAGEIVRITYQTRIDVVKPGEIVSPAASTPAPKTAPPLSRTYADFDVLLDHPRGDCCPVHVLNAPAGEARGDFRMPFPAAEWAAIQAQLNQGSVDEATLRGWGRQLFEALFRDQVATCLSASRAITAPGKGLRLRLRIQPGALAELPWELLYDPQRGEFLTLSTRAPVVRHLHVGRPVQLPALPPPLHMLTVVASPENLPTLDVQKEVAALRAILQPLIDAGQLHLHVLASPTARALREHLLDHPCHLLHFIGHGGIDAEGGYLVLEDEHRQRDRYTAAAFCRLFGGQMPRFAMLNACLTAGDAVRACVQGTERAFVGVAPALVRAGVTAVVAMQFPISDRGAHVFSADFYRMLVRRGPVDEAIDQARIAVTIDLGTDNSDWSAPVLFLRRSSGELFPS
jgi:tetratricopeptide (TPR) repeat protein